MIGNRYEYDMMAKCERQLWWYRCLHELTLNHIKANTSNNNPRILDAGCGTGGLLLYLQQQGFSNLTGFDLSADAVEYATAATGIDIKQHDIRKLNELYAPESFDIIVSHDIVCLLQEGDDALAVKQLLSVLKPGGKLIMNFPAFKAFNGSHDIAVGIQRRYTKKSLRGLMKDAAVIRQTIYWPFFLSPPIFMIRNLQRIFTAFKKHEAVLSDVKMPGKAVNSVLHTVTTLENRILSVKPWGSSLFVVLGRKIAPL